MNFSSLKYLDNFVKNNSKQIIAQYSDVLKREAKKLKDCIQRHIDAYYKREPVYYGRTLGLQHSLTVDEFVVVEPDFSSGTISIYFNNNAIGKSYWDGHESNKAALINYGWEVKKDVWFKDIEHFGYQEGYDFIGKGISDYLKQKPKNISLTFTGIDGKQIHG